MSVIALDSSCMVAAVCSWHERHAVVAAEIDRRLAARGRLAIPAQALVEAYAVLTRLPAPHRIAPADAWALLSANFVEPAKVVALEGLAHAALWRGWRRRAWAVAAPMMRSSPSRPPWPKPTSS